jgi:hypothetical protein
MEKELAASGWKLKLKDDLPILEEELFAKIEETALAMDANLKKSVECMGTITSQMMK